MTAVLTKPPIARPSRLGAVSYLNTLPMIEGLGKLSEVTLTLTPPSELAGMLTRNEVDVALASSIDYQRSPIPLAIVPVGMIGSSGPTLTVRLFSRVPIHELTTVACDIDSHTSVALLRIVLHEQHGFSPDLVPFDAERLEHHHSAADDDWPESLLLIGDKVVTASPPAIVYPHQLDLGEAWKSLTGLPFVYAVWMCRADEMSSPSVRRAAGVLDRQRRRNAYRIPWIAARRAAIRGWPNELAARYLAKTLSYRLGSQERAGLERFHRLAYELGLTDSHAPLRFVE